MWIPIALGVLGIGAYFAYAQKRDNEGQIPTIIHLGDYEARTYKRDGVTIEVFYTASTKHELIYTGKFPTLQQAMDQADRIIFEDKGKR